MQNTKMWYESKEIWLAIAVIVNGVLGMYNLPALEVTPEVATALGIIFFWLRGFWSAKEIKFTDSISDI